MSLVNAEPAMLSLPLLAALSCVLHLSQRVPPVPQLNLVNPQLGYSAFNRGSFGSDVEKEVPELRTRLQSSFSS